MGLRLGDTAPDFTQESTKGSIHFYDWLKDSWAVLFSHPADFTPVCTTELGAVARLDEKEFAKRGVKVIAVSVDPVAKHNEWIKDINETQKVKVNYPILGDADHKVSHAYDMLHPGEGDSSAVRSLFIIDPKKKIRAIITYPKSAGRNFNEILRVIDSLQLTDKYSVATPADWNSGDDVVIVPSLTDPAELKKRFPKGYKEVKPYLRTTPQPDK
jgi:alkyl hydroperoxide reductase subunit AhpC